MVYENYIYIIIGLLLFMVLILTSRSSGRFNLFSPPMVFSFFVLIGVFFRSVYFSFFDNIETYEGLIDRSILFYGYLTMMISVFFYCLGYLFPGNKNIKINFFKFRCRTKILVNILVIYAFIALFSYFYVMGLFKNFFVYGPFTPRFYDIEGIGRTSLTYLTWGADILFVIFLYKLSLAKSFKHLKKTDYVYILVPIYTMVMTTNRGDIVLYLIGVMCVNYSMNDKKIPFVKIILLLIIVVGGLGVVRGQIQSINKGIYSENKSIFITTFDHMMKRPYHMAIDKTSVIVYNAIEKEVCLYGKSIVSILYAPVPRLLWKEKPSVRIGPWVAEEIYERENRSGVPPGFIAELFLNFSWLGISVGMFLYGIVCRIVYNSFMLKYVNCPTCKIFYSIFLVSFVIRLLGADFVGACSLFLRQVIPFLIVVVSAKKNITLSQVNSFSGKLNSHDLTAR